MASCPSKEIHGYDSSRFEEAVAAIFHCSICSDVLKEPRSCRNNDHLFCLDCISAHLKGKSKNCPECRDDLSLDTLRRPRDASNYISKLKIRCDYAERGCHECISVESLEDHLKDCGYAPVVCSNEHCGKEINKQDIIRHENEVCEYREANRHGYRQGNDFEWIQQKLDEELKKTNEKLEKGFKKMNEAAVQEELKNVNAKVEEQLRNMDEKVEAARREIKKEAEGVKENVKKDVDEIKVMISKMMEKLNQLELLNKRPYLTEGMLDTPKEDILIAGYSRRTEIYSWEKNAWFEVSPMNERHTYTSSFIRNDQLFVVAGCGIGTIEKLDLNKSPLKWMNLPASLPYECYGHQTVVHQHRIILIGGHRYEEEKVSNVISEARVKRRSFHAPNLTSELSATQERRLIQFSSAKSIWSDTKQLERRLPSHYATMERRWIKRRSFQAPN